MDRHRAETSDADGKRAQDVQPKLRRGLRAAILTTLSNQLDGAEGRGQLTLSPQVKPSGSAEDGENQIFAAPFP